ncbi:MAG: RNA pyrophosphohydrolase [Bdellovibrionales bacterium]|nr:RNA pyrophosphohydrolase [Bdellovibrionales bacterium]
MKKLYRRNVAAVVVNANGEILACERSDVAGAWQLPQGGIEADETPEQALLRELKEEIGTCDVEIIGSLPEPIKYDWPEKLYRRGFHGQEQNYFLVRLNESAQINLNADANHVEFSSCRWMCMSDFLSLVSGFKSDAYREALTQFAQLFPDSLKLSRGRTHE